MPIRTPTTFRSWVAVMREHWRPIVHWAVLGVAAGFLATQVPGLSRDLVVATVPLGHLRVPWLALAALTGLGGLVLYAEIHRQLLRVGGARLPVSTVQGITFAQNAIANTVPVVGGAGALVYAIDQLRRHRVDVALASWTIFLAGVLDTIALLVLGVLGLGWAANLPLAVVILSAGVIGLGAAGCWVVLTHPTVLQRGMRVLLVVAGRLPVVCSTCRRAWASRADQAARRLSTRVALLRPDSRCWLTLIGLVMASWLLDFCTLMTAVAAVGTPVPVGVLIVGFLVVQGSIALQIFPGGAGLAATGLLGVLLTSGIATAPAAATTLLYRSISWFALTVIGWIVYVLRIHTGPLHLHRHAPEHA